MLCSGGGGRVDYGALRYFHEFWPSDNTDPVVRVPMQWDYSYFFPPMSIVSHVTHSGQSPAALCVQRRDERALRHGPRFDQALSPEDRAICEGAISAYKRIREVTQLGDLYRLERPHEAARGALSFVSSDRSRAVLFVFQLQDAKALPVRPEGLDGAMRYVLRELNPPPGRASLSQEGKSFTGEELMRAGILPPCEKALEACVIELSR